MKKLLIVLIAAVLLASCTPAGTQTRSKTKSLDKMSKVEKKGGEKQGFDFFEDAPQPAGEGATFLQFIADNIDQFWAATFEDADLPYASPKLDLTDGPVQSGCGRADASSAGPFYCPRDTTVYFAPSFSELFDKALKVRGDFVLAYAMAHEFGHHIQYQLSFGAQSDREQLAARSEAESNAISVKLELQADCFAGVWANSVFKQGILEKGDINEAQSAASAIGDDNLRPGSTPEDWNHGPSLQRRSWFTFGYVSGDPARCDSYPGDRTTDEEIEESIEDERSAAVNELDEFFTAVQPNACEDDTDRSDRQPLATITCEFGDIAVDYDKWTDPARFQTFFESVKALGGTENPWSLNGIQRGRYIELEYEDAALLVWTYDAELYTGFAAEGNGNKEALRQWWTTAGARATR